MRRQTSRGIITKNKPENGIRPDPWQFGLLAIAFFLRIYRIDTLTEFLGDQGRTMLILERWFHHGVIPFAGPTTLTGEHLGPMFYYILAPGYLLGGLVGTSVWCAILGTLAVLVLYRLAKELFPSSIARGITLLWAVSPMIVSADRIIWEPNLVPLFVLLFLFCFVRAHRTGSHRSWFGTGIVTGILLQLHYPTIVFPALMLPYCLYMLCTKKELKSIIEMMLFYGLGVFIPLIPFFLYEVSVGFRDIIGIGLIFSHGGGMSLGKRAIFLSFIDYLGRVMGRLFPDMTRPLSIVFLVIWLVFSSLRVRAFTLYMSVLLLLGLFGMSRYPGVVHDHYLFFLIPLPFLMVGFFLSSLKKRVFRNACLLVLVIISCMWVSRTDVFHKKNSDVWRVRTVVDTIAEDSNSLPFSFTLIRSSSFSDLHYRYMMEMKGLQPQPITDITYPHLYIICDASKCPDASELLREKEIQVICFDEHCEGAYPSIRLSEWQYEWDKEVRGPHDAKAHLYRFQRRPFAQHGETLVNLVQ